MRQYNFTKNGKSYQRISRAKFYRLAADLVNYGDMHFIVCACNLKPEIFGVGFTFNELENDISLDSWINAFEYYNCTITETGKYASFYMEVE